eukprot:SAG11_NODE_316_length_10846_cov_8.188239_14_plen_84_part_00
MAAAAAGADGGGGGGGACGGAGGRSGGAAGRKALESGQCVLTSLDINSVSQLAPCVPLALCSLFGWLGVWSVRALGKATACAC